MLTKRCSRCKEPQPVELFSKCTSRSDGLQNRCRPCVKAGDKKRYLYDPELLRERGRQYRKKNPDYHRSKLLKEYGLTVAQYDTMLAAQGGVCLLCFKTNNGGRRLAVDHCHKTGAVRGLLCNPCNTALGKFQDDPEMLRRAAIYLEQLGGVVPVGSSS